MHVLPEETKAVAILFTNIVCLQTLCLLFVVHICNSRDCLLFSFVCCYTYTCLFSVYVVAVILNVCLFMLTWAKVSIFAMVMIICCSQNIRPVFFSSADLSVS